MFCELCGNRFVSEAEDTIDEPVVVNEDELASEEVGEVASGEVRKDFSVPESEDDATLVNNGDAYYSEPTHTTSQQYVFSDYKLN